MNKLIAFLMSALLVIVSVSCSDDDEWEAGPQPAANNAGVYFDKSNPRIYQVETDKDHNLIQDYFSIVLGRDEAKSSSALQVPVIVRVADSNMTVPQTVNFAAGSSEAELKVSVKDFDFGKFYNLSLEIDENYAHPYQHSEDDENGGSSRIDAKMEVVCLYATATFTPKDYSGSPKPEFVPFQQKIYDNLDGTYSIGDFLMNGVGRKMTFSLDEDNNILPAINNGYHDLSKNYWYFYSANASSSSNRIPCYIPGNNPDDYITYIYFYTVESTSSYQAFWLDLDAQKGRMMGYSRYSVSESGRIAFDISW